jgi:hypothetical protein
MDEALSCSEDQFSCLQRVTKHVTKHYYSSLAGSQGAFFQLSQMRTRGVSGKDNTVVRDQGGSGRAPSGAVFPAGSRKPRCLQWHWRE